MNPKLLFYIYMYGYLLFGFAINCMGPIIPYFSKASGIPYTQFSFLFFARALGYLAGGYLNTKVAKQISSHKLLSLVQFCSGIFFLLSTLSFNFVFLGICFFFAATFYCNINVVANICVIRLFEDGNQDFWLQLLNIMFGVGGLVAPFFINIFQEKTFFFLGVLFILASPILYFIPQPFQSQSRVVASSNKLISSRTSLYFCLLFLLFMGFQFNFSSWAPSYLLLTSSTDIQTATFSASLLWFSNVGARCVLIFYPGKTSKRLLLLHNANAVNIIFVSLIVLLGLSLFGIFFGSVSIGAILSSIIPLYYALPKQFELRLTQTDTAHFMMASSLGQAIITMPVGYAIQIFGPFFLFISEILIAVSMYLIYKQLLISLNQQSGMHDQKITPLNQNYGVTEQIV